MPKAVEIEDFAVKLGFVCRRLNWSRGKVALRVGVDKSLASRWLAGSNKPTRNSLMRLNQVLAEAVPGFSRSDWDRDPSDFFAHFQTSGPSQIQVPVPRQDAIELVATLG
jgi:transcriptional regulator with XRE-family HTH domain